MSTSVHCKQYITYTIKTQMCNLFIFTFDILIILLKVIIVNETENIYYLISYFIILFIVSDFMILSNTSVAYFLESSVLEI